MIKNLASYTFDKLEEECQKCEQLPQDDKDMLWNWGLCYYYMGKHSEEMIDFKRALEKYKKVEELGCDNAEFYNDFGRLWLCIEKVLGNKHAWWKAADYFARAIELDSTFFEALFNYACVQKSYYEHTGRKYYFNEAYKSFHKASNVNYDDANIWKEWGDLLLCSGQIEDNKKLLEDGCENFAMAFRLSDSDPFVEYLWGGALVVLGVVNEDLSLIKEGEGKIVTALELLPDNPDIWAAYGESLDALGTYFLDSSYYESAMEKFQYAISLDGKHRKSWHGLNQVRITLGLLNQNKTFLEKALEDYHKGIVTNSEDYRVFDGWGVAYLRLATLSSERSHVNAAIEKFEKSIELQRGTTDLDTLYNYGYAFDFLGDLEENKYHYEKAVEVFLKLLELDNDHDDGRYNLALAQTHLGEAIAEVDYFMQAIENFEILITKNPEDEQAWSDYGVTLMSLGILVSDPVLNTQIKYFEEAVHKFSRAAALGSGQAYYNLACVYSMSGQKREAMVCIEKADEYDGLPSIIEMENDEWLEDLWNTTPFQNFLQKTKL